MTSVPGVVIHGAAGRMGQALLSALVSRDDLTLTAAMVAAQSSLLGQPVAGFDGVSYVCSLNGIEARSAVIIDFTGPEGLDEAVSLARSQSLALLSGSTGLSVDQQRSLDALSEHCAVLWTANTSIGMHLLNALAAQCAKALGTDWDIEISETHHRDKRDAPSGTALMLAESLAQARGAELDALADIGRQGRDLRRRRGDIGIASMRGGDVIGEHTVLFAGDGERIELTHKATDRSLFARGALTLATRLAQCKPGRYQPGQLLLSGFA